MRAAMVDSRFRHWEYARRVMLPPLPGRTSRLARAYARVPSAAFPRQRGNCSPLSRTGRMSIHVARWGSLARILRESPPTRRAFQNILNPWHSQTVKSFLAYRVIEANSPLPEPRWCMFYRKVRLACAASVASRCAPISVRQSTEYELLIARPCRSLTKPTEVDAPLHLPPSLNDLKAGGQKGASCAIALGEGGVPGNAGRI